MLPAASQLLQSTPMTAAGDTLKLLRLTLTAQLKPADIEFAYLGNLAAAPPGEPLLDEEHAQCLEAVFQRMQHAHAADTGANHALTALTSLLLVIAFSWKLHIPCAMSVSEANFMIMNTTSTQSMICAAQCCQQEQCG